jgi:hypothetical protein
MLLCKHCHKKPAARGKRGLCWGHYQDREIRHRYPISPFRPDLLAKAVTRFLDAVFPPSGEPTDAPPGTEARLQVYALRAERHEPLFHPQDTYADARPILWTVPEMKEYR